MFKVEQVFIFLNIQFDFGVFFFNKEKLIQNHGARFFFVKN